MNLLREMLMKLLFSHRAQPESVLTRMTPSERLILETVSKGKSGQIAFGCGKSRSAERRRQARGRGKLHTGRPGQLVKMSDRMYHVAKDGSFQRVAILDSRRKAA